MTLKDLENELIDHLRSVLEGYISRVGDLDSIDDEQNNAENIKQLMGQIFDAKSRRDKLTYDRSVRTKA